MMKIKTVTLTLCPCGVTDAFDLNINLTTTGQRRSSVSIRVPENDLVSHFDLIFDNLKSQLRAALEVDRNLLEDYNQLIMAVAHKFPGESRHQTALRYIRQAEASPAQTPAESP